MDISGTIASVLWTDSSEQVRHEKEKDPTFEAFTQLVREERRAREAALAEMRKMLDWRFVHFAEEFRQRLARLEGDSGCTTEHPQRASKDMDRRSAMVDAHCAKEAVVDEPRLHFLEGKFSIMENRVVEVQRWLQAFEDHHGNDQGRFEEAEAHLAHLDRRVTDVEGQLGGRRGSTCRLAAVERISIDAKRDPARGPGLSTGNRSSATTAASRSVGGSSVATPVGACGSASLSQLGASYEEKQFDGTPVTEWSTTPVSQHSSSPSFPRRSRQLPP